MKREMPSGALELYAKFTAERETNLEHYARIAARNQEESDKAREKVIIENYVRTIFKQGTNILDEFGIVHKGTIDIGAKQGPRIIRVHTPSVALDVQGEKVNFTIQGVKRDYDLVKSPPPNPYEYISAHIGKEVYANLEDDTDWLFRINQGTKIDAPFDVAINDPEVIQAASSLFNVIQQSLSETHTPRSQQLKPKPKSSFFRRIISPRKA